MDNWDEVISLFYKQCKCNDKTTIISDIYAAKQRHSSAKLLNGSHLHFSNDDL